MKLALSLFLKTIAAPAPRGGRKAPAPWGRFGHGQFFDLAIEVILKCSGVLSVGCADEASFLLSLRTV